MAPATPAAPPKSRVSKSRAAPASRRRDRRGESSALLAPVGPSISSYQTKAWAGTTNSAAANVALEYAALLWVLIFAFVVLFEEPTLRRRASPRRVDRSQRGARTIEYEPRYSGSVPRASTRNAGVPGP